MGAGHGFTMDSDGRMVVAISPLHPWSGLLQLWDTNTGEKLADFAPYGELLEGTGITFYGEDEVLVADWFGRQIVSYDVNSRRMHQRWTADELGFSRPISLEVMPTGEVLILDDEGVVRWDPEHGDSFRWIDGGAMDFHWARNLTLTASN